MRERPPGIFTKGLSGTDLQEVTQWWSLLSPVQRRGWRDAGRPPPGVVGRFVEPGTVDETPAQWLDFYEYLVNHEIRLEERTFHICSAHEPARSVISAGRLPAAFVCPRKESGCPMRVLLDQAPGRDILLSLAPRRCA